MPERIQANRSKSWRVPPDTVRVDAGTKWANPFVPGSAKNPLGLPVKDRRHAFVLYRSIAGDNAKLVEMARAELRGKNLACVCEKLDPYDDCCHAAVLLEIANAAESITVQKQVELERRGKGLRYVQWHAAAYGAPAPTDEIAREMNLPVAKARVLLRQMEIEGLLVSQPDRYPVGGWHEPQKAGGAQQGR